MSLGAKVQQMESGQNSLDDAVRDLMKVVSITHEVVGMILKEQMELRQKLVEMEAQQNVRFEAQSKHNNRVEDILIQIINRLPDQPAT